MLMNRKTLSVKLPISHCMLVAYITILVLWTMVNYYVLYKLTVDFIWWQTEIGPVLMKFIFVFHYLFSQRYKVKIMKKQDDSQYCVTSFVC